MKYITSPIFSILINGTWKGNFKPTRGIRQGDPLSRYIFIIRAEYLDCYLHYVSTTSKSGIGIHPTKEASKIPYLRFTDDYMIFNRKTKKAVRIIKDVLDSYENESG